MLQILNNTEEWKRVTLPNFGTQTRLRPSSDQCIRQIEGEYGELIKRFSKALRGKLGKYIKIEDSVFGLNQNDEGETEVEIGNTEKTEISRAVRNLMKQFQGTPSSEDLKGLNKLKKKFVFMQMDKGKGRMIMMCPKRYGQIVHAFREGEDFEPISEKQEGKAQWDFFSLRHNLKDKRFIWKMPNPEEHRFGVLCLWPKKKNWEVSIENGVQSWKLIKDWDTLKCRPLVSYHEHYYNKILSIAGQALVGLTRNMEESFHVDKPQKIISEFHDFAAK